MAKVTRLNLRGLFLGDKNGLLFGLLLLIIAIVAGLLAWVFYERTTFKPAVFFKSTESGQLFETPPLNQPGITEPELLQWTVNAVDTAYAFNFVDYRKSLLFVREFFTTSGYRHYIKALTDSNTINAVINEKYIVAATPTSAPFVIREGVGPDKIYTWQVRLPILVTFNSSEKQKLQYLIITMSIKRVPTSESKHGVAIASFFVSEGKI